MGHTRQIEMTNDKISLSKTLSLILAIMTLLSIIGSVFVTATIIRQDVDDNTKKNIEQDSRLLKLETTNSEINARLSSIDTNLEFIKKSIERNGG